jgi:hypothetical protein
MRKRGDGCKKLDVRRKMKYKQTCYRRLPRWRGIVNNMLHIEVSSEKNSGLWTVGLYWDTRPLIVSCH